MTKIIVYAHLYAEDLYQKGIDAGLSRDAAEFFRFFNEVKLELDVEESGLVTDWRVVHD